MYVSMYVYLHTHKHVHADSSTHTCIIWQIGIAGAPVTHWDGYDTHYTERYMGTPQARTQSLPMYLFLDLFKQVHI